MASPVDASDAHAVFESLMRRTQDRVRAYIGSLGVPVADVDDVAQEVYLDCWRRPEHPPGVPPEAWLCGMARRCALEYFRRRSRQGRMLARLAVELDALATAPQGSPSHPPVEDALVGRGRLDECLDRLEPSQRALLTAHYREGHSIRQLASRSQRSADAVHMQFLRLRTALKRCLERGPTDQA